MKVAIKDLKPNPFRNMPEYPINKAKLQTLIESIKSTTFWDNLLARKKGGKYEIAYGHHRLIALKKIFKKNHTVNIPVRELSDEQMLRIMAEENMQQYDVSPKVINETVKSAKEFLDNNPDIAKKHGNIKKHPVSHDTGVGINIITHFLSGNWSRMRVRCALRQLKIIKKGKVDKTAIEDIPRQRTADKFIKAKEHIENSSGEEVSTKTQRKVAKRIKGGDIGTKDIHTEMAKETFKEEPEKKAKVDLKYHIKKISSQSNSLYNSIDFLLEQAKEHPDITKYLPQKEFAECCHELRVLIECIRDFASWRRKEYKQLKEEKVK